MAESELMFTCIVLEGEQTGKLRSKYPVERFAAGLPFTPEQTCKLGYVSEPQKAPAAPSLFIAGAKQKYDFCFTMSVCCGGQQGQCHAGGRYEAMLLLKEKARSNMTVP